MEIEIKYHIPSPSVFQELLSLVSLAGFPLGPITVRQLRDRYLDTDDMAFLARGFACRLRQAGSRWLVTLKGLGVAEGGLHKRVELEAGLPPGADLRPIAWPAGELQELAMDISQGRPLQTLFELWQSRHERIMRSADLNQAIMAVSLDQVRFYQHDPLPVLEIEGELLPQGQIEELQAVAQELEQTWHLLPQPLSKFERGLRALQRSASLSPGNDLPDRFLT